MAIFYLVPKWFFGFDVVLEILFALISIFVAWSAWRMYKLCDQRQFKWFSLSFFLIAASYFFWALVNLFVVNELNSRVRELTLSSLTMFSILGVYAHIFLFTAGLVTLLYTTFKLNIWRPYLLLLALSLLAIVLSDDNKAFAFYVVSSLLIGFIVTHYALEFSKKRKPKTLALVVAFILILLSHAQFILSSTNTTFYVIGHVLELAAYTTILVTLISTLNHEQKKNKA